jgi:hypothetical protein
MKLCTVADFNQRISVFLYQLNNEEDGHLHTRRRENVKFHQLNNVPYSSTDAPEVFERPDQPALYHHLGPWTQFQGAVS